MQENLFTLINIYLQKVEFCVAEFQKTFGDIYPIKAWRDNLTARTGQLNHGLSYEFHGIGCTFLLNDEYFVDFDFTPDLGHNGFDLWRLKQFILENNDVNITKLYPNIDLLERDFHQALSNHRIMPIAHSRLFRLNNNDATLITNPIQNPTKVIY